MATYAIGDIQGCFAELQALLALIKFNPHQDSLWCCGDLVNRGPDSLGVLRFLADLPQPAVITLGNHDLHYLAVAYGAQPAGEKDTLEQLLSAPDGDDLREWLRQQAIVHDDAALGYLMVHAGVAPQWDFAAITQHAAELTTRLHGDDFLPLLQQMYSNQPDKWDDSLSGIARARCLINYFTRMRYCDAQGRLNLAHKGPPGSESPPWQPWFSVPRQPLGRIVLFGHWAALMGQTHSTDFIGLDTGCVWGEQLSAYRIEDQQFFRVNRLRQR